MSALPLERASNAERTAAWALLACAVLALLNLPSTELPMPWLLAFTLPAAALGRLPELGRWPIWRAVFAMVMQTAACFLALQDSGPLSRPAALACTILPPLAYVCVRRRDTDAPLGLFLSFCVLLVGMILGGMTLGGPDFSSATLFQPRSLLVVAYAFCGCLVLRSESLLTALRYARFRTPGSRPLRNSQLLGSAGTLTLVCLLFAAAFERTLTVLPSPSGDGDKPAFADRGGESRHRAVGLDETFELDGNGGILSDLHGEQLARVRAELGGQVPRDLYLRSGFFSTPDMDRWLIGPVAATLAPDTGAHELRAPRRGVPVRWLEVERFAGALEFVLTPPGTTELRDLPGLIVDPDREFLRQRKPVPSTPYLVGYQELPPLPLDAPADPRGEQLGLLGLPARFDEAKFAALMTRWRVRGMPMQVAERIAAGLERHCRYERLDPTGPFVHAIENFLFADTDRHGYCMHFASAAALMLRLNGVPCRIGVGLYGGVPDPADADARIYGSQHAHAWVEIPFAGRGYVVFDPTPPEQRGRGSPTSLGPDHAGAGDTPTENVLFATWRAFLAFVSQPWLLIAVLAAAIVASLRPTRRVAAAPATTDAGLRTPRRLLGRILKELARAGFARAPRQTIEQYARSLATADVLSPELRAAFAAYQEVRFGGRGFDAPRQQTLQRALQAAASLPSAEAQRPRAS